MGQDGGDDSWGDYQGAVMGDDAENGDAGDENAGNEESEENDEGTQEGQEEGNGNGWDDMQKSLLSKVKRTLVFKM